MRRHGAAGFDPCARSHSTTAASVITKRRPRKRSPCTTSSDSERFTQQSAPLPGQAPNSAAGNAWAVDDWTALRHFPLGVAMAGADVLHPFKD